MNCIKVSITKLNERIKPSVLKHKSINVQSFSIGEKLNAKVQCNANKMNVKCSIMCSTSVL